LSIFGVAIGTVLLPSLSKALRTGQQAEALDLQEKALSLGLRLSIPSAFGLILLSYPIIDLIYGHGNFSVLHVQATAPALAAFVIGLPAYTLSKVFTTGFFAKQNTKTPLKIGMITVGVNLALNLLFIGPFLHVGMALATGLAAWVQTGLLAWKLSQKSMIHLSKAFFLDLAYVVLASTCMGVVVYQLQQRVHCPSSFINEAIYVVGLVGIGILTYGGIYKICLMTGCRYKKNGV
jgi:putative peptidoglycan lipid II flippase